jgi:hypothetical protein
MAPQRTEQALILGEKSRCAKKKKLKKKLKFYNDDRLSSFVPGA